MNLTKLSCVAHRFVQKNVLLRRTNPLMTQRNKSIGSKKNDEDELDAPVKFSNSPAAKWDPVQSRTGRTNDDPWYQPIVVGLSTIVFLVYFCILREENDVDQKLTLNLSDHFTGEAKENLLVSQSYALEYAKKKSEEQ